MSTEKERRLPAAESTPTIDRLSAGVVCHSRADLVPRIVAELVAQGVAPEDIRLVDVASGADFDRILAQCPPGVALDRIERNLGPNPARNLILAGAPSDLVLLLDDDCLPAPGCVSRLLAFAHAHKDWAFLTPCFVYMSEPDRIQVEGGDFHPVGEALGYHAGEHLPATPRPARRVGLTLGGCLLVRRPAWAQIGGFDPDYFFGRTDGEFLYRLGIAGHRGYVVPAAVCRHDMKPRGLTMGFYQVRNRWILLATCYAPRTLILLLPSLLVHEIGIAALLVAKGQVRTWARAVAAVVSDLPAILAKRRRIQRTRIVPDSAVLRPGSFLMRADIANRPLPLAMKRLLEQFYTFNWHLIRRFV